MLIILFYWVYILLLHGCLNQLLAINIDKRRKNQILKETYSIGSHTRVLQLIQNRYWIIFLCKQVFCFSSGKNLLSSHSWKFRYWLFLDLMAEYDSIYISQHAKEGKIGKNFEVVLFLLHWTAFDEVNPSVLFLKVVAYYKMDLEEYPTMRVRGCFKISFTKILKIGINSIIEYL